jgi:WD40 repeat protein
LPKSPQDQQQVKNFAVRAIYFDETKQQIVTTGNDKTVKMWNLQGQPMGSVPVPGIGWCLHMAGPYLFVGCEVATGQGNSTQGLVQAFNTQTNESWQLKMNEQTPWSHGTRVSCLVTNGGFLFTGGGCWPQEQGKQPDNDIRVWQMNPQTKQFAMASAMQGHQSSIMSMCLTTDTKFLCSGDMLGNVAVWNSANGSPIVMIPAHQSSNQQAPAFIMDLLPFENFVISCWYVVFFSLFY